jgi:hypothetical protein
MYLDGGVAWGALFNMSDTSKDKRIDLAEFTQLLRRTGKGGRSNLVSFSPFVTFCESYVTFVPSL